MDNHQIIPLVVAQKLIEDHGGEIKLKNERKIAYKVNGTIVGIPNQKYFDFEYLEEIAIEQLDMHNWEFDLWLGENASLPSMRTEPEMAHSQEEVSVPLEEE